MANFHSLTPFPGTDLYDNLEQYGTVSEDLSHYTYQGAAFVPHTMSKEDKSVDKDDNDVAGQTQSHFKQRYLISPVFGYGDNISTGWGIGLRSDFYFMDDFNLNLQYAYHYGSYKHIHGKMWYLVSEFGYLLRLHDFTVNPAFEGGVFNLHRYWFTRTGLCYGFNFGVDYTLTGNLSLGFDYKGLYGPDNIKIYLSGLSLDFIF